MSLRAEAGSPRSTSGARYIGVPVAASGGGQIAAGAEIHQHDAPVVGEHHVLGLDVAVHETGVVHGAEGAGELDADGRHLARREGAALGHCLVQRASPDELHPQADVRADALGAVDGDHVRMPHAGQGASLLDRRHGPGRDGRAGWSFNATSQSSRVSQAR